jgi:hypothetical protein
MTKKESSTIDRSLVKDCGKLIVISTIVVLILGLVILSRKKKNGKTESKTTSDDEKCSTWELQSEIKKLETRQQNNISRKRESGGDPLAD